MNFSSNQSLGLSFAAVSLSIYVSCFVPSSLPWGLNHACFREQLACMPQPIIPHWMLC